MGTMGEVAAAGLGARALPTGTVTFLFTDLEGSTRLLQAHPDAYREAVARHHDLLRGAVEGHGGVVFETVGDAVYAAFAQATEAVAAALAGQQALHRESWGEVGPLRARMGVHLGEVEAQGGHYFGAPLYRCARLTATAHGGQVVLSEAAAALVRDALPAGAGLRDLGEHRLKDLARPERVFQLADPALPGDFPPLRSLDARPHNLPLQLTSFVGRERELGEVARLLAAQRLVTLTGPGGTGKTRLALQAAADALEAYPDGVWLAELGALADPALVPHAVAAAVGVREEPGRPLPATLLDALRPKRLLLLLDNCEHLLEACTRLADALLRACPGLGVLATSREALGIAGEAPYRVPSLSLPEPGGRPPAAALAPSEAVTLFAERAAVVRPGFAVTGQNAPAVAQVCRRLDGIPLALELAAARVRVLTPEQLLSRLEDRFRLLTGGSRTALERHQTLQATVDWSYALLTEPERRLFARLAVFAGGWTLEAAEAVGADPEAAAGEGLAAEDVLDLLTRLVDQSLVVADEQPDGEARYRLLETLRQYAQERLLAGGAAAAHDRHAGYFLAETEARAARVEGAALYLSGRDFAWFAREHDNLRAALGWLRDRGDAERGLRLGAFLGLVWVTQGHLSEGRARLAELLALPGAAAPTGLRARALVTLGGLTRRHGDYAAARALFAESLAVARAAGDRQAEVWALFHLANLAAVAADAEAVGPRVAEMLALAAALGDPDWQADADRLRGLVALQREAYAAARSYLEAALAAARAGGRPLSAAYTLMPLGHAALGLGDRAAARAHFAECLAIGREFSDETMVAEALGGFAGLAAAAAQPERAARLDGAAAALRTAVGAPRGPAAVASMNRELAPARQALDPERYAAAWAEGQTMPLEQAAAYALEDTPDDA